VLACNSALPQLASSTTRTIANMEILAEIMAAQEEFNWVPDLPTEFCDLYL
jgi:hypothetical protein